MVYFEDGVIVIRDMREEDIETIHAIKLSYGSHSSTKRFERYFGNQQKGNLYVFIAECDGVLAGYTTLRPQATTGPFAYKGIPEVSDLDVFEKYQRRGIGSKILDVAEKTAVQLCSIISLAVGMHSGYGSAQRLYIKRGYIPDGSGIWYKDNPLEPYTNCCNDDDLVLYLSKRLV